MTTFFTSYKQRENKLGHCNSSLVVRIQTHGGQKKDPELSPPSSFSSTITARTPTLVRDSGCYACSNVYCETLHNACEQTVLCKISGDRLPGALFPLDCVVWGILFVFSCWVETSMSAFRRVAPSFTLRMPCCPMRGSTRVWSPTLQERTRETSTSSFRVCLVSSVYFLYCFSSFELKYALVL